MMKPIHAVTLRIFAATAIAFALATTAIAQTESILHSFTGGNDGGFPQAGMIFDSKGNLYGTAGGGGSTSGSGCIGCGVAFQLVPSSNGTWTENILYAFGSLQNLADGANPYGSLIFDAKGNLYGTTISGGTSFQGTVFELSPTASGPWTETVLYNFSGGADGGFPYASKLLMDGAGNLYGMTESGGLYGFGTVFEVMNKGNGTWTERVLHNFQDLNDGANPFGSSLIFDSSGNLYGVASGGGAHDYGVVFELVRATTGGWTQKVLYSFPGGSGGSFPTGNLVIDSAGNLYGQAFYIAYELSPNSNGTWTEKTLHTFGGGSDGATPYAGFTVDGAGNLYGTTNAGGMHRGTVFELLRGANDTWTEKILHRFSRTGGDGVFPTYATVTIDGSGKIYGTTPQGGASGNGVIFEIAP
jgi:uncharacterized repeat protein (TIGR03803 family)